MVGPACRTNEYAESHNPREQYASRRNSYYNSMWKDLPDHSISHPLTS